MAKIQIDVIDWLGFQVGYEMNQCDYNVKFSGWPDLCFKFGFTLSEVFDIKYMKYFLIITFNLLLIKSLIAENPPLILQVQPVKQSVGKFEVFELLIEAQTEVLNRFDFDSVMITANFQSPDGESIACDAFYYQHFISLPDGLLEPTGSPHWRIRFTPHQIGNWQYTVKIEDVYGVDVTSAYIFDCLPSSHGGFVRPAEGSTFLEDENGQTIFLVGENIAWANQVDGSDAMGYYLQQLHAHEMNFAKLMMTPWGYQIEWGSNGLKNYENRQRQAFLLDSIFRESGRLDIFLQLAFSIHNELNFGYSAEDWTSNPYNVSQGGMCNEPYEFFGNDAARNAFKNRLRYLNARFGYATNLMGWELLSEADNFPWYSDYKSIIADWGNQMATFLKSIDQNDHLISVGFALTGSNPEVWEHSDIGFTQMHIYDKVSDIEGDVFRQVGMYSQKYSKPMVVGEFGLGHNGDSLVLWDPQGLAIHNALWTSALSGSPATIVPWFWENYIDFLQLYPLFTPVARYMENENLSDHNYLPIHFRTVSDTRTDYVLSPKYTDLSARAPSRQFVLHATGQLIPAADSLTRNLYGPVSIFAGLRQPPEIEMFYEFPTFLKVVTGAQAIASTLQLTLDGSIILEEEASPYTEYLIEVPAGQHTLKLDNAGSGFFSVLEISEIIWENTMPAIRAFGLQDSDNAFIWIHNRQHNWKFFYDYGVAPSMASGCLKTDLGQGNFQLEWYNTSSGLIDSTVTLAAGAEGLEIIIESLTNDVALKIRKLTTATQPEEEWKTTNLYPNPSNGIVTIEVQLEPNRQSVLNISDAQGNTVFQSLPDQQIGDKHLYYWNGCDSNGRKVRPGIYIFRIISDSIPIRHGKLIRF